MLSNSLRAALMKLNALNSLPATAKAKRDSTHRASTSTARPSEVNMADFVSKEGLQALKDSLLLDLTMIALDVGHLPSWGMILSKGRPWGRRVWIPDVALRKRVEDFLDLLEQEIPGEPPVT